MTGTIEAVPKAPTFFELGGEHIAPETHGGQRSWFVRARDFVTVVTWAAAGEAIIEPDEPDDYLVVVPEGVSIDVAGSEGEIVATGPSVLVVPPQRHVLTVRKPGYVLRVFTARGEAARKASNAHDYRSSGPAVPATGSEPATASEPATGSEPGTQSEIRYLPLGDGREGDALADRTFRTRDLMITYHPTQVGPSDTDALSRRISDDIEQASVTLSGDHVHHVRRPWGGRMRDWRPDEHVQVMSPSVTVIPPGNMHVTRGVGRGAHVLIDVSAAAAVDPGQHEPTAGDDR